MNQITAIRGFSRSNTSVTRSNIFKNSACGQAPCIASALIVLMLTLGAPEAEAAVPAAGDAYVYRVINGYTRETVGQIRHEVTAATTAQGTVISVTADKPSLGVPRTELYTADGQWLRRGLDSHGSTAEYEFTPPLPVYVTPTAKDKSWSVRVNAKVAGDTPNRSVRIDSEILSNERIRVPAGEFDTIKIQRIIYAGDKDYSRSETRVTEVDWYAPALGRSVRSETRSGWRVYSCGRGMCDHRGDWNVVELVEAPATAR